MSKIEDLIAHAQAGDTDAAEKLLQDNVGLIWSVARRFVGRGIDLADLYQLGCLGFVKAVQGFEPAYGTQFSTYAVPKIAGEIRRFLRDDGSIKVSRGIKEKAVSIKLARTKLIQSLGREPTLMELSEATGISTEDIAIAETATACVESIQQETGEDGFTLESILTDTQTEDAMIEQIALRQAIDKLPEREKMLVRLRYFHGLTQHRVSVILGVSQVQVSRIEKKALCRLKELMN